MSKAVIIVIDGVGVGQAPDAELYNDVGSNTLGNLASALGGIELQNFQKLGLGNIIKISGVPENDSPLANFGKMMPLSKGKDSTSGHWEIGGLITEKEFPLYPNGFPNDLILKFLNKNHLSGILGNIAASGTEIIKQFGEEHLKTAYPIIYTSADSVFQIAAHEEVIPIERLYEICQTTRNEVVVGEHAVGRVIARPFLGQPGNFYRTERRKDFALRPHGKVIFDVLTENNIETFGIGKINDLFAYRNIANQIKTKTNLDGIQKTINFIKSVSFGFIMTNLVDFDQNFGHRNDIFGFANALIEFDNFIPEIIEALNDEDLLFIVADHGNDPTTPSTDHSREFTPLLVYGKKLKSGINLGIRNSFADVSKTICDFYKIENNLFGKSFYSEIIN